MGLCGGRAFHVPTKDDPQIYMMEVRLPKLTVLMGYIPVNKRLKRKN